MMNHLRLLIGILLIICCGLIPGHAEAEAPATPTDWSRWQVIGDLERNPDDRSVTLTCGNCAELHRQFGD